MLNLDLIHRRLYDYQPGDIVHFYLGDETTVGIIVSHYKLNVIIEPQVEIPKFLIYGVTKKGERK